MTDKDRLMVSFDKDVFEKVLAMRAQPDWARKSMSRIVNDLLKKVFEEKENPAS